MILVPTQSLEQLRLAVDFTKAQWSEALMVSERDYENVVAHSNLSHMSVRETALEALAASINITTESIFSDEVDYGALSLQQQGRATALPDYLTIGAFSRMRTSAHLLDLIEKRFGWRVRSRILRRHQVTEAALADLDRMISIRFLSNLCLELKTLGATDPEIQAMGSYSLIRNLSTPLGDSYRALKNPKLVFEKCFTEIINQYYDRNYLYRLAWLAEDTCVVEAVCNPDVTDALHQARIGNQAVCVAKSGTFNSIMGYLNLPFATTVETSCIHRGDSVCRFVIDFSQAKRAYLQSTTLES